MKSVRFFAYALVAITVSGCFGLFDQQGAINMLKTNESCVDINSEIANTNVSKTSFTRSQLKGSGKSFFESDVYPFVTQNCGGCHGISQVPKFAVSDTNTAYTEALKKLNTTDPLSSALYDRGSKPAHCSACGSAIEPSLKDLLNQWADAENDGGSGGSGEGENFQLCVNAKFKSNLKLIPNGIDDITYIEMRWNLTSQVTPKIAGLSTGDFVIQIKKLGSDSYIITDAKFENLSGPLAYEEIRLYLNGKESDSSTYVQSTGIAFENTIKYISKTSMVIPINNPNFDKIAFSFGNLDASPITSISQLPKNVWLKADAGIRLQPASNKILNWLDQSGNDNHAFARDNADLPSYFASGGSGAWNNPFIQFDGIDDAMLLSNGAPKGGPRTMILVGYRDGSMGGARFLSSNGNVPGSFFMETDWDFRGRDNSNSGFAYDTKPGVDTGFNIGTVIMSGSELRMYGNGELASTQARVVTDYGSEFALASSYALVNSTFSNFSNVEIAELIFFDYELQDSARKVVECYLANKYGDTTTQNNNSCP